MISSNVNALGIIFPNSYDSFVPELVSERLMASIPFASRYRMIDFLLSSMVNSGIDNISIIMRQNYRSRPTPSGVLRCMAAVWRRLAASCPSCALKKKNM
jgi:hypothetical protein